MPVSETPNTARTFSEAEVRAVVRTLRSYGPLPKRTVARLVGDSHWRDGSLEQALRVAAARELVRPLGAGFYAPR